MIAAPVNDRPCLDKLTEVAQGAVERDDVRQLAARFDTTAALATWIRSLPQRNDDGDPNDGPRVACDTTQRARVPADTPNCVERSLLFLAAAEHIDPEAVRQLATIDTSGGRHTFPVEDGRPVVLDPTMPRNALRGGLYQMQTSGDAEPLGEVAPEQLLPWIAGVAHDQAPDLDGRRRVREARAAFGKLTRGEALGTSERAAITYTLTLAREAAPMFGPMGEYGVRLAARALGCACSSSSPGARERPQALTGARNARLRPDWRRLTALSRRVDWERAAYWGGLGAVTVAAGPAAGATYATAYAQVIGPSTKPDARRTSPELHTLQAFTTKKG